VEKSAACLQSRPEPLVPLAAVEALKVGTRRLAEAARAKLADATPSLGPLLEAVELKLAATPVKRAPVTSGGAVIRPWATRCSSTAPGGHRGLLVRQGDAAAQSTGKGIISANPCGPTKFIGPGTPDVRAEGKGVHLTAAGQWVGRPTPRWWGLFKAIAMGARCPLTGSSGPAARSVAGPGARCVGTVSRTRPHRPSRAAQGS